MYFGKNGERYPIAIFKRLSEEEQASFIEIDDDIMNSLLEESNNTNCEIVVGLDGRPKLKERIKSDKDILKSERNGLQSYLNSSDYVGIHYGELRTQESKTIFLDKVSNTFNMSNMNILIKREEARDRIDELRILLI